MYEIRQFTNLIYDPAHPEACLVDICEPVGVEKPPLLIFFHGGGLVAGNQTMGPELFFMAQEHGIAVASAEYRKYPDAAFPDFIVDAANAVAWLEKEWKAGEKYAGIYVGGSSAGGYLSLMLCFAEEYLKNAGVEKELIRGWIFNAGQPMSHYRVLEERGIDSRCVRIDDAAPIWHLTESFRNKPTVPVLILAADHDMVNRLEQNVVFKTALLHFDYPAEQVELRVMEGYNHCGYDGAKDENGRYIFADIMSDFIRRGESA